MSITFATTRDITKAFESAKASGAGHSVIVVHQTPEDALVCDIHLGAYTVEGLHERGSLWAAVKRGGDHKKIVAHYPVRNIHAVYIVEGEASGACRCHR